MEIRDGMVLTLAYNNNIKAQIIENRKLLEDEINEYELCFEDGSGGIFFKEEIITNIKNGSWIIQ